MKEIYGMLQREHDRWSFMGERAFFFYQHLVAEISVTKCFALPKTCSSQSCPTALFFLNASTVCDGIFRQKIRPTFATTLVVSKFIICDGFFRQ
jgi:hypothetical protein